MRQRRPSLKNTQLSRNRTRTPNSRETTRNHALKKVPEHDVRLWARARAEEVVPLHVSVHDVTLVDVEEPVQELDVPRLFSGEKGATAKSYENQAKKQRFHAFHCISFVFLLCFLPKRLIKICL